jgi:enoyl-CoA hydratase/carnithine racemase
MSFIICSGDFPVFKYLFFIKYLLEIELMEDKSLELKIFLNSFTTLEIKLLVEKKILVLKFNRPNQLNALNEILFEEIGKFFSNFEKISNVHDIRVIIITGKGKAFSSGLDLKSKFAMGILEFKNSEGESDVGRKAFSFYVLLKKLQESLNAIESCHVPVIAAVNGFCLGGAMSILACADVRIASKDAKFSIKEIDIGLTADLGALQRLIKQTGNEGLIKKYSYTGETFSAMQAMNARIIEEVIESNLEEDLLKRSIELAESIAAKSPLVLWGIKRAINFARDNTLSSSLDMVATLNSALIQANDISDAVNGFLLKKKPIFPKL